MSNASNLSEMEKAAIFMLSLPSDQAAAVMKHLRPKQVQRLGVAMASLQNVDRTRLESVMGAFMTEVDMETSVGLDSTEHIRSVLIKALGEDKAQGVIDRILLGANTKGLDTLKWMDPKGVADIIRTEHPQIQAIVLSYLDPDQAAEVVNQFEDKQRLEVIMRIANLEAIQPSALKELNDIMEKQFAGTSKGQSKSVGGLKTAAEIMNYLDSSIETKMIESMKVVDPKLTQNIQDLMFVFENLINVDDRGIQVLLREVQSELLVLALKGANEALRTKVFKNMSKRAAEMLKDDMESRGPVRLSEVEAAQKEILAIAHRLADAGEMVLASKGGEEMIG